MTDGSALAGLRVIDLSRNVAGPFASMLLGDLGADVIKVERPPRGDEARRHGPPFLAGESPYFLSLNRNKRSIVLDLKQPEGRAASLELLDSADIAVSNYRPGVLERLGLGADELRQRNPRLVLARITGFGTRGPWAARPAYDHIIQGMSGLMSVTGSVASGPFRVGVSISDVLTGVFTVYGVLAAIHERERTGRGQVVDAALLASTIASLTFQAGQYLATGERPRPSGNDHPMISPYGTFATADGHLNLAVGNDAMFGRLCGALGRPDLASDQRYLDNPSRVANRSALAQELDAGFRSAPTGHWLALLSAAEVACGPILGIDEALQHAAAVDLEMVREVEHARAGTIRLLGFPVRFSDTPAAIRRPPPLLGEHTAEVLAELGYDEARILAITEEAMAR